MSKWSNWAVGTFDDHFALELMDIVTVDLLLFSRWSENVTSFVISILVVKLFCTFLPCTHNRSGLFGMIPKKFEINTFFIVDRTIILNNTFENSAVLTPPFGEVGSDVTKTLDNASFSFNSSCQVGSFKEVLVIKKCYGIVKHT